MPSNHVSTNLRQGLRRNLSMHVAVVLTLFVSLSLAGIGVLLNKQADLTTQVIGDKLQLTLFLCVPDDNNNPSCQGEVTTAQKQAIVSAIEQEQSGPQSEVKNFHHESKQTAYAKIKQLYGDTPSDESPFTGPDPVITVADMPQTYWITLDDPKQYKGVLSAVQNLPGVSYYRTAQQLVGPIFTVIDFLKYGSYGAALILILAAILLVANTIRLAALARRKEIEIMRLVGASRIFIALPFVLEALVTAVIGVVLACGALAAFTQFAIIKGLAANTHVLPFVGWSEFWQTAIVIAIVGPVLTIVPTLVLTRKYLRV